MKEREARKQRRLSVRERLRAFAERNELEAFGELEAQRRVRLSPRDRVEIAHVDGIAPLGTRASWQRQEE